MPVADTDTLYGDEEVVEIIVLCAVLLDSYDTCPWFGIKEAYSRKMRLCASVQANLLTPLV